MSGFFKKLLCLFLISLFLWDSAYYSKKSISDISYNRVLKLSDYTLNIFSTMAFAEEFMNSVSEGRNLGNNLLPQYKPESLNDTLQQKGLGQANQITPRADEANQEADNYKRYYTNPEGMAAAPIDESMQSYVEEIYYQSEPIERTYRSDQTFGNKCLATNEGGQCQAWSLSDTILYDNYPDCQKVAVPRYDQPQDLQKCITTKTSPTISDTCQVTTYMNVQEEIVHTPCSMQSSTFVPNQVYAVCKDYYTWYRVPGGSNSKHNTPTNFVAVGSSSEVPGGSVLGFQGSNDENYSYSWYYHYDSSKIERLILSTENSCGMNFKEMTESCTALYLELCDANWQNCVVVLENGELTGQLPELNNYMVKRYAGRMSQPCSAVCELQQQKWGFRVFCPSGGCYEGACDPNAPYKDDVSGMTLVGRERANVSNDCYDASEPEEPPPPPPPGSPPPPPPEDEPGDFVIGGTYSWDEIEYYVDRRVCRNVSGGIEDYIVCLKGDKIEIDNGTGFKVATNPATRVNGQCQEVGVLTVTYYYLYGAPDLADHGYYWNARVKFSCGGEEDDESACKPLIDRGCVYHSHVCLDSDCYQKEYTYNCGGTGQVAGYDVQYICSDGLRCMGSECMDTSYEANKDFAQAATGFALLNNYRADTDPNSMSIFPGEKSECQVSPKNCCEKPGVGITIGDYIRAGLAAIKVYSLISAGIAATWDSFAVAFTQVLTGQAVLPGLARLLGVGFLVPDKVVILTTSFTGSALEASASQAIGANMTCFTEVCFVWVSNSGLVSSLATVFTIVSIALVVYTIIKFIYDFIFRCTQEDIITSYKVGLNLCHYVGKKKKKFLGVTYKKKNVYCCFNTILARLVHECVRPQVGRGWGDPNDPDCGGLTPGELGSADMSKCDFTEYMQHVQYKTEMTQEDADRIRQKLESQVEQIKSRYQR